MDVCIRQTLSGNELALMMHSRQIGLIDKNVLNYRNARFRLKGNRRYRGNKAYISGHYTELHIHHLLMQN